MNQRWFGVGVFDPCDRWRDGSECFAGRVTSLYLQSNQLQGALPAAVGNLSNLSFIDLSWNEIISTLPPELGAINNVEARRTSPGSGALVRWKP